MSGSATVGGEGGIRTREPREGSPAFKSEDTHASATVAHAGGFFCNRHGVPVPTAYAA